MITDPPPSGHQIADWTETRTSYKRTTAVVLGLIIALGLSVFNLAFTHHRAGDTVEQQTLTIKALTALNRRIQALEGTALLWSVTPQPTKAPQSAAKAYRQPTIEIDGCVLMFGDGNSYVEDSGDDLPAEEIRLFISAPSLPRDLGINIPKLLPPMVDEGGGLIR